MSGFTGRHMSTKMADKHYSLVYHAGSWVYAGLDKIPESVAPLVYRSGHWTTPGEALGFSREHVAALRLVAARESNPDMSDAVERVADIIETLLPPI